MKSPHMYTFLPATLPWVVHHYVPTIHLPSTSGNTPHCTCSRAPAPSLAALPHLDVVSGRTESWGLKLLRYLLCLQGSDTEEKESWSSVTSSPNDKQIDPALWLWQSKQG